MLAYDIRGDGPHTELLLHGFLGSGRNLASLTRRLAETQPHTRWVVPDLTGHGASPPLPAQGGLSAMAADVVALLDYLTPPQPVRLIGHSLGGRVALAAALLRPAMVDSVVLLDISPGAAWGHVLSEGLQEVLETLLRAPATAPNRETMREFFTEAGVAKGLADWVTMNLAVTVDGVQWRIDCQGLAAFNQRQFATDLWEAVRLLGPRCTCVRGERSQFVSDADVARFLQLGARVHTLAGAGHFVHVDNQPALLQLLTT